MLLEELFSTSPNPPEDAGCIGIVYRADVQHCKTQRGILFSIRLNKLKKKSCPGCSNCGFMEDDLGEIDPHSWPIIDIEKAEHGKLYTLAVVNMSRDWEGGFVDSWDLKLVPYAGDK